MTDETDVTVTDVTVTDVTDVTLSLNIVIYSVFSLIGIGQIAIKVHAINFPVSAICTSVWMRILLCSSSFKIVILSVFFRFSSSHLKTQALL